MPFPSVPSRSRALAAGRIVSAAAALALLPALGACNTVADATGSVYPSDHRDRHPIKIADAPRVIDLFVEGEAGLSRRGRQDLADFVAEYRGYGRGPLMVQVPVGAGHGSAGQRALAAIRQQGGGRVAVSSYQPADPSVASPIRLTFSKLQAKVASACGLWPQDIGVSDYEYSASNEPYWNLGCSTQAMIASQVDDPSDLIRGRRSTSPDTIRRTYNIEQLRKAVDPSTAYRQTENSVQSAVGGSQ